MDKAYLIYEQHGECEMSFYEIVVRVCLDKDICELEIMKLELEELERKEATEKMGWAHGDVSYRIEEMEITK